MNKTGQINAGWKPKFEFVMRAEMTIPMGTLHGGVMAAIMDDMIGATIICLGRDHFYTTPSTMWN